MPYDNEAYPSLSDSRNVRRGIRSLMGFSNLVRPLALSVLYPRGLNIEASPRTISGRTSYLWVRLAFHPYPQLIQRFCNNDRFGPSRKFSCVSAWPWIDHPVSGLMMQTMMRPCQTRFRSGSGFIALNLPAALTRRIITQKARDQAFRLRGIALSRLVSTRFQVLFHSPPGVLFAFPSRY